MTTEITEHPDDLLTDAEAAAIIGGGVKERKVRTLRERRKIKPFYVGLGHVRIRRGDLQAFIDAGGTGGRDATDGS